MAKGVRQAAPGSTRVGGEFCINSLNEPIFCVAREAITEIAPHKNFVF